MPRGVYKRQKGWKPSNAFKKGFTPWNKGIEYLAIKGDKNPAKRFEVRKKLSLARSGENCTWWKGGIAKKNRTERQNITSTFEYRFWRTSVFERDNYTCVVCGVKSGNGKRVDLNADHIKPFLKFPELRFDINNGRTLCVPCHRKTDTYGSKIFKSNIQLLKQPVLSKEVV